MARLRRSPRPGLNDASPARILTQICLLQLGWYATATALTVFTALTAGKAVSLALVLDWRTLRGDITEGYMFGLVWILSSAVG